MLQLIMKVEEVTFPGVKRREKDLIMCAKEKQCIKGHALHKNLLKDGCTEEVGTKITELGLLCAQTSPKGRPILDEVLTCLNQISCKYWLSQMLTYCLDYHHTYHMLIILLKLYANKFILISFNRSFLRVHLEGRKVERMEDGREKMEERIDIFYHLAKKKNGRT